MKIEKLIAYENDRRAEAAKQKPDSKARKLADAAVDLIQNDSFRKNLTQFLADPLESIKLTSFHKTVITDVYGIFFRSPIR